MTDLWKWSSESKLVLYNYFSWIIIKHSSIKFHWLPVFPTWLHKPKTPQIFKQFWIRTPFIGICTSWIVPTFQRFILRNTLHPIFFSSWLWITVNFSYDKKTTKWKIKNHFLAFYLKQEHLYEQIYTGWSAYFLLPRPLFCTPKAEERFSTLSALVVLFLHCNIFQVQRAFSFGL